VIPLRLALRVPERDGRVKPGHDDGGNFDERHHRHFFFF
jgi:hypothetical protein